METETWLEKAERLRSSLAQRQDGAPAPSDEAAARERITIALWLRREFSAEAVQEDTSLPLEVL